MKKSIAILLMAAVALSAAGCAVPARPADESSSAPITAESSEAQVEAQVEAVVSIKSATVGTNYNDDPALIVVYTYTNNTDKARSFTISTSDKAFQGGVECESTFSADMDGGDQVTDVQPGVSIDVTVLYELRDTETPVDITVTDLLGFTTYLEQQVTI